jgi:hypothetical protein
MRRPLTIALAAFALTTAAAAAVLPLAPLSSVGPMKPAPAAGTVGPEGVPIPNGPVFADVRAVKLGQTIDGVTCQQVEKIAFHTHAHLTLFVSGNAYVIPYGIGIGPPIAGLNTSVGAFVTKGSCFMWLHTHAADGIIHMEAPKLTAFTLGQFFDIWGIKLSRDQVGSHKGQVTAFYNGKVWTGDLANIPLPSEAQIQLDIGKPIVAPEHIRFPKGLAPSTSKSK